MAKKPKAAPKVTPPVSTWSCLFYFSDRAVICPFCRVTVPKATQHSCEKTA